MADDASSEGWPAESAAEWLGGECGGKVLAPELQEILLKGYEDNEWTKDELPMDGTNVKDAQEIWEAALLGSAHAHGTVRVKPIYKVSLGQWIAAQCSSTEDDGTSSKPSSKAEKDDKVGAELKTKERLAKQKAARQEVTAKRIAAQAVAKEKSEKAADAPVTLKKGKVLKRFTHKTHSKSHHEAYAQATAFCKSKGGHLPTLNEICPKGEGKGPPALGCVSGGHHSWVPYSKNSDSWVFIACGGHGGKLCKDHVKHHGSPNWAGGDVYGDEIECMIPRGVPGQGL